MLVDTNVLIYATLEDDPRFSRSRELLLSQEGSERFVSVQTIALELCEKCGITRRRYYDAQMVAAMIVHGIETLLTENAEAARDSPLPS